MAKGTGSGPVNNHYKFFNTALYTPGSSSAYFCAIVVAALSAPSRYCQRGFFSLPARLACVPLHAGWEQAICGVTDVDRRCGKITRMVRGNGVRYRLGCREDVYYCRMSKILLGLMRSGRAAQQR